MAPSSRTQTDKTSNGSRGPKTRARRAVSDADKAARRDAILSAAETQLLEAGFEAFSMEVLARSLAVARGTLYRYFPTREAVLLELYLVARSRFANAMTTDVTPGMDDVAFVECWYDHATSDPLFLMLQARLGSVIERNIPGEMVIAAKRAMQAEMSTFAEFLAGCLAIDTERARRLIVGLVALLLGATELDNPPPLTGLPQEIVDSMAMFASRRLFTDNARLILDGLRREAGGRRR